MSDYDKHVSKTFFIIMGVRLFAFIRNCPSAFIGFPRPAFIGFWRLLFYTADCNPILA